MKIYAPTRTKINRLVGEQKLRFEDAIFNFTCGINFYLPHIKTLMASTIVSLVVGINPCKKRLSPM